MTPFEQKLAAFQQYMIASEPKFSDQTADIIGRYYTAKANFAGVGMGADPGATAAAVDTTNILDNFIGTVLDQLNNGPQTRAQLAAMQIAAQAQNSQAAAVQGVSVTTLAIFGALGLLAVLALKRR